MSQPVKRQLRVFGILSTIGILGSTLFLVHMPKTSAQVPDVLPGGFKSFVTPLPQGSEVWDKQKPVLRSKISKLFGDLPPLFIPEPTIHSRDQRSGYTLEKFTFVNGVGDTVYGYTLIPKGHKGRGPAILYNHYHGGQYKLGKEGLLTRAYQNYGSDAIPGETLVGADYVVMCIDSYAFGERRFQGPAGKKEEGSATESSLYKTFAWEGINLWGMMVQDDRLALSYLISRPEVNPKRIATMGMSMGSTRSWWLAAMDERVKVVISTSCLTRYQNLIAHGGPRYHGIYYFVPGMLKEKIDAESVIGLIAPRAHLTLTGDSDKGSPVDGVITINEFQEKLYRVYKKPGNFKGLIYKDTGHVYSEKMWLETMAWLKKHL